MNKRLELFIGLVFMGSAVLAIEGLMTILGGGSVMEEIKGICALGLGMLGLLGSAALLLLVERQAKP